MPVSVAAKNICPVIGEGPHWEENSKSLLFVDITTAGYYRWNSLDGTCEEIHADSGLAGFIIPRQNGGYLVSNDARILHLDFASRKLEPFLTIQPDELDLHLNDAKCDSKGRLWAGTMGRFNTVSDFVKEAGCLYRIDKDLKPFVVKEKTNVSNGITWTTDEKTMFYTHSIPRKIFSYYYDIHSGEASREQVVVDFTDKEWSEYGIPDGMTMDVMDKLWVAAFKSSRVFQIDPETGKILQTIKFPVSEITSCCFGGPNYDELYVTSSHLGLTDEEFKNNEPLAGSLFKVTETGAKGRAAFSFQGYVHNYFSCLCLFFCPRSLLSLFLLAAKSQPNLLQIFGKRGISDHSLHLNLLSLISVTFAYFTFPIFIFIWETNINVILQNVRNKMSVSVALKNVCQGIGEGPHWEERIKSLLFVDEEFGGFYKWNSIDNTHTKFNVGDNVSFIIPRESGGYLVSYKTQLAEFDWESQQMKPFLNVEPDKPGNCFNDGKCDSSGRLVAGTMKIFTGTAEMAEAGRLYRIDKDLSVNAIKDKINISNGMAWTADDKTMFYTHSLPKKVFSYDYDISTGEISREQVVIDFEGKELHEYGIPDGMTIDLNDKIWLASHYSSKVFQIDPETGKILSSVKFPTRQVTSCCFGGPNYDELYVTSRANNLTEKQLQNEEKLAGSVFKVTELGAKGKAAPVFQG
ncbi:uncharacterized protein LOC106880372 [Octopus bimaculoides]|nr:uncharacterized protein LOC106880372 [Octopus bimaculoides]